MNTGELRRVLAHQGPFATVHLDGSHDTENAAHEQEPRWRAARAELAEEGAAEDTLTALDDAVRNRENEGADFDQIAASLATERARAEQDGIVEEFRAALAADRSLAVQGLAETTSALREHNAAAVVISDPTLRDAALWMSDEPMSVALTEDELRAIGAEHIDRARADEALPAAALMVGAELVSAADVRGEPVPVRDGIGVLLRHRP